MTQMLKTLSTQKMTLFSNFLIISLINHTASSQPTMMLTGAPNSNSVNRAKPVSNRQDTKKRRFSFSENLLSNGRWKLSNRPRLLLGSSSSSSSLPGTTLTCQVVVFNPRPTKNLSPTGLLLHPAPRCVGTNGLQVRMDVIG